MLEQCYNSSGHRALTLGQGEGQIMIRNILQAAVAAMPEVPYLVCQSACQMQAASNAGLVGL